MARNDGKVINVDKEVLIFDPFASNYCFIETTYEEKQRAFCQQDGFNLWINLNQASAIHDLVEREVTVIIPPCFLSRWMWFTLPSVIWVGSAQGGIICNMMNIIKSPNYLCIKGSCKMGCKGNKQKWQSWSCCNGRKTTLMAPTVWISSILLDPRSSCPLAFHWQIQTSGLQAGWLYH